MTKVAHSIIRPLVSPEGDNALRLEFGATIDPKVNRCVHTFSNWVKRANLCGVLDVVPAYSVLTVYYDPLVTDYDRLAASLSAAGKRVSLAGTSSKIHTIPVLYGGECGVDLGAVATACSLTQQDVIDLHSGLTYLCYMIGFLPGFPYLGEVPQKIRVNRHPNPRLKVARGSVALAQAQTGIYPSDSPGGWNVIGRTPIAIYLPNNNPPCLIAPGDRVTFVPITSTEFERLRDCNESS